MSTDQKDLEALQRSIDHSVSMVHPVPLLTPASLYDLLEGMGLDVSGLYKIGYIPE